MKRAAVTLAATCAALTTLTACPADEPYIIVTVANRPAVHDATALRVTLSNEGASRTDDLTLGSAGFPVTFSVSAPGRTGALTIQVDALDAAGLLVGRGVGSSTVESTAANVMLETTDFVINTDYAGDQYPSNNYESHGSQVAAATDGTWTAVYSDKCSFSTLDPPCNMMARRFDSTGRALTSRIAASTNAFPVSTILTDATSTPAVAVAGTTTLAAWDFDIAGTIGVACRAIDPMGGATADQKTLAADPSSHAVAVTPLSNSNFAVSWEALITTSVIRSAIVKPDCTLLGAVSTVSAAGTSWRPSVAASGSPSKIMYSWYVDGDVHVRLADNTNAFSNADSVFLPKTATERVDFARVAPFGTGFAVLVRWSQLTGSTGPGRIELYRTNNLGAVLGAPILVTSRTGSDFQSNEQFSVATRADGVMMVVWHSCLENGDGMGCGVFGRAFRPDGTPVGDELTIPTTTLGDQINPSVAALPDAFVVTWRDDSAQAPDVAGSAVRARIVYPGASGATQ